VPDLIVRELAVCSEGSWGFEKSDLTWQPAWLAHRAEFDPFPCYPHDMDVIRASAASAAAHVPPLWDVALYVADREEISRTNGFSTAWVDRDYDEDGRSSVRGHSGLIVLSGKRVQPHPAMSRYLVAHEYGHNVHYMLCHLRGKHLHDDAVIRDYAAVRGIPDSTHHGSGGRWHDSAHELVACDFRILVLGAETEFWPHPGIARPEEITGLREWWAQALADLARARSGTRDDAAPDCD
jgi:hypothetical protein